MKPYVNSGCVKSVVLWNPVDLGYAAVYAMRAEVDGKLKAGATELDAGKLGQAEGGQRERDFAWVPVRLRQVEHRKLRLLIV